MPEETAALDLARKWIHWFEHIGVPRPSDGGWPDLLCLARALLEAEERLLEAEERLDWLERIAGYLSIEHRGEKDDYWLYDGDVMIGRGPTLRAAIDDALGREADDGRG